MAETEIERILRENYGQGFTSPPVANFQADPQGETAAPVATQDINATMERMYSGFPGMMRGWADRVRDDSRPDNLVAGGLDSMANWFSGQPRVGADTVWPMGMAGVGSMGLGLAGQLAPNTLGIFGGRLARTADHQALTQAQEMSMRGFARDDIWDQTGWFQGADGQWRFEIPDRGTRVTYAGLQRPGQFGNNFEVGLFNTPSSPFTHPNLSAAYPESAGILMRFDHDSPMETGAFNQANLAGTPVIDVLADSPSAVRNIALHELQHWVQNREGFAQGSNMDMARMRPDWQARVEAELDRLLPLYERTRQATGVSEQEMRNNLRTSAESNISMHEYNRSAGEVEARNVMRRRNYSDEQRRTRPPWTTEDVPATNQFVRTR